MTPLGWFMAGVATALVLRSIVTFILLAWNSVGLREDAEVPEYAVKRRWRW